MIKKINTRDSQNSTYHEAQISVADVLLVITQELRLIFTLMFSLLGVVVIYLLLFADPVYISYSTILPTGKDDDYAAAKGMASQFGISIPGADTKIDITSRGMLLELLKSKIFAHQVLEGKVSISDSTQPQNLKDILFNDIENIQTQEFYLEKGNERIHDLMAVNTDEKSPVIQIAVSTSNPHYSASLNQLIINSLDSLQKRIKQRNNKEKLTFVTERTSAVKEELTVAEDALKQFMERNRMLQSSSTLLLERERLLREVQVQSGVYMTLKQELERTKIEMFQNSSMIQVVDTPSIAYSKSKPRVFYSMIMSIMFGGFISLGIIFIKYIYFNLDAEEKSKYKIIHQRVSSLLDFVKIYSR